MRPVQLTTRLLLTALVLTVSLADAYQQSDQNAIAASKASHQALIARVLELTNKERAKAGVRPLTLQKNLSESADWMANDLSRARRLSHQDSQGRGPSDRANAFEYAPWKAIGENLAAGTQEPEEVVQLWLNSAPHRNNLLDRRFTEVGIGFAEAPKPDRFKSYWVQALGTR